MLVPLRCQRGQASSQRWFPGGRERSKRRMGGRRTSMMLGPGLTDGSRPSSSTTIDLRKVENLRFDDLSKRGFPLWRTRRIQSSQLSALFAGPRS